MNPDLMAYLQKRRAAGGPALPEFDETFANLDAVDADRWHAPLKYGPGESLPDVSAEEPEVISPPRRVVTGAPAAAPPQKSMRDMLYERLRKSASQPDTSEADNANLKTLGMWDAVTPGLTNIRNIFLQGAGLAPTAHEPSNRAQQLREYLTKKYNTQTDDLQAGAALEEKDALGKASAQAKAEAKVSKDASDAKKAAIAESEREYRRKQDEIRNGFAARQTAAAETASGQKTTDFKRAQGALSAGIPYAGGVLTPVDASINTEHDRQEISKKAESVNTAYANLGELEKSIKAWIANPTPKTKAAIQAQVPTVSGSINTAQGQGALTGDEFGRAKASIGADITSAEGLWSLLTKDDTLMLTKLQSVRRAMEAGARGAAAAHRYKWQPKTGEKPRLVRIKDVKTGYVHRVPADMVPAQLDPNDVEVLGDVEEGGPQ